jgi:S-(hydroxymethyl)glutathione dehydrogenase/alcohol dehydrogenase
MKSRAALTDGKGAFFFDEINVGEPEAGEVRVRVKAAGVCHTDWDSLNWGPLVLGHEGAGIVQAVGNGVVKVKPGDPVVLNWAIPCGRCFQCQRGNQVLCEAHPAVGLGRTRYRDQPIARSFELGTMSDYTVVPEAAVTALTQKIPFASAAILGCGVMTGVGSVLNAARVEPGSTVAVIGTGGVGLNVIQGARLAGAGRIIAIDVNPERLELARQFGATELLLASRDDTGLVLAAAEVRTRCGGRGADYAFECTAVPALGAAPLAMVRNAGTAVQVSGIEQEIAIDMKLFEWDKLYLNPLYGKCRPDIDFPRLLAFYASGALLLDEMVTRTYPLEELQQAFDDMHAGRNAKGVLVLE